MSTQQLIGDFIAKWGPGGASFLLNEEQGAQQHFIELRAVLGVPTPAGGDDYVFEHRRWRSAPRRSQLMAVPCSPRWIKAFQPDTPAAPAAPQLTRAEVRTVRGIVDAVLGAGARVRVFGSRATGRARPFSASICHSFSRRA